jgi:uncharacterized protein YhaN
LLIKKLHIYGYGKIIDQEIDLTNNLHIFYGENEAGKTTIKSFIHSMLFGFPTKNQQENRYQPRSGMKYGGKLIVETKQFGTLIIERVAGKAIGDVTVYFGDGTVGGETELNQILHGMNKRIYTSIFSFGIQGLQDIQTIKADDLSHYLLSTSVLGNDQLIELEKKIVKEMDSLFKPSGKKPELNQDLEGTALLSQQVHATKGHMLDYQQLVITEQTVESEINEIKEEIQAISLLNEKLNVFEQYHPLKTEWNTVRAAQECLGEKPKFPVDGIQRLDQLLSNLLPIEARLKGLYQQYEENKTKASSIAVDEKLVSTEKEIKSFSQQYAKFDLAKETLFNLERKIESLEDQTTHLKSVLGIKLSNLELGQFRLTLSIKDEMKNLLQVYTTLCNKKELLDQQQERLKDNIEASENNLIQYETQLLKEDKKQEIKAIIVNKANTSTSENDKHVIRSRYERLTTQLNNHERRNKRFNLSMNFLILPISVFFLIFGILDFGKTQNSTALLMMLFAVLLGAGGLLITRFGMGNQPFLLLKEEQTELFHQIQAWEKAEPISNKESRWMEAQQQLAKDEHTQQIVEKEKLLLQQFEKEYERSIQQFQKWEQSWYDICSKLDDIKARLIVPTSYSYELLLEFYEQFETLVATVRDLEKLNHDKRSHEKDIEHYIGSYNTYIQSVNRGISISELSPVVLVDVLEAEKDKKRQVDVIEEKQMELADAIDQLNKEALYFNEQILALFSLAEVDNEDAFRHLGHLLNQWNELDDRLKRINEKIMLLLKNNIDFEQQLIEQWDELIEEQASKDITISRYKKCQQKEKELLTELAKVKVQKKQLEEAGTYSSLLQQLETRKAELNSKVKKWAKLAIAKDVLQRTKDFYRQVRLPEVIQRAEVLFSTLTNQAYVHLFLQESSEFIVERKDGARFSPEELSQATSEQLYLSLRLALVNYYQSPVSLPLIIDDSFVNFDESRFRVTMKVVEEISKKRQVIFLTCHHQAIQSFEAGSITYLGDKLMSNEIT